MKSLTEMGFDWSTLTKRAAPAPRPKEPATPEPQVYKHSPEPGSAASLFSGKLDEAVDLAKSDPGAVLRNNVGKAYKFLTGVPGNIRENLKDITKDLNARAQTADAIGVHRAPPPSLSRYNPEPDSFSAGLDKTVDNAKKKTVPAPPPTSGKSFMDYLNEYKLPIGLTGLGLGLGGAGLGYYMHRKKKKKPYEVE